jgi:hypothetical protein
VYRSITFYVPQVAVCRVDFPDSGRPYFRHIETWVRHRRKGYCTSLVSFVFEYTGLPPEMDIRNQSTVMKHVAFSLGYDRVGVSERFGYCSRWVRNSNIVNIVPRHSGRVIGWRKFGSDKGSAVVLYIQMWANHSIDVETRGVGVLDFIF